MRRQVFVAAVLGLAACRAPRPSSLQIPLRWTSPDEVKDVPPAAIDAFRGQSVAVVVADARQTRAAVGENVEGRPPAPVTTKDDVPGYVGRVAAATLSANAIKVVSTGATRALKLDVQDFFVSEENTYQARVTLGASLVDAGGAELWHGVVRGTSKRFGHSFDEVMYGETLSNATLDAVLQLLGDDGLQAAARGK